MIHSAKTKIRTDDKILVECDFKVSPKCKRTYSKIYRNVLKGRQNNNGKDRCQYCFNSLTKTGNKNYNYKYPKIEGFFEHIDTELKAYLLGWVAGDGCLAKDGLKLSIHKKDKEILILFQKNISPTCPIKYRRYDNTENLIINSVKIVSDLCRHLQVSVGKKSDKITLPKLKNDDLLWAFIRGLFDSDGSINDIFAKDTNPRCNISSISTLIKLQLFDFFQKYNIKTSISKTMVHFGGFNALNFLHKIYKDSNYALNRKKALYEDWSTWVPHMGTAKRPRKIRDKSTINLTGLPWYKKRYKK